MPQNPVPKKFHWLLWDTAADKVDVKRDKWYVVENFVNHGTLPAMKWLFSQLNVSEIVEVLKRNYNISTNAIWLWGAILNFDPNECECMKRPLALRVFD